MSIYYAATIGGLFMATASLSLVFLLILVAGCWRETRLADYIAPFAVAFIMAFSAVLLAGVAP